MTRFLSALAFFFSLLSLVLVGVRLTSRSSGPQTGLFQVDLDSLRFRLGDLEDRLQNLVLGLPEGASGHGQPAVPSDRASPGGDDVAGGSLALAPDTLARLETIETRLLGLEGDPVQRAYIYLQSGSPELRRYGVRSLESMARSDPDARAALHEMLLDPDAGVCATALNALGDMGDKDVVPLAAHLLEDDSAEVRREAIQTLTRLGAKDVAPEIVPLISDENDEVRRAAVDSMGTLGYKGATPALLSALDDPNLGVRGEAISSLGEIGATESLPRLRDLYADQTQGDAHKDADHRVRLAMAMKQLGDPTAVQSEITRLGKLVHYSDNGGAMRALMWIGRDEPLAAEVFRKAAEVSQSEWIRHEARRMLEEKGHE